MKNRVPHFWPGLPEVGIFNVAKTFVGRHERSDARSADSYHGTASAVP